MVGIIRLMVKLEMNGMILMILLQVKQEEILWIQVLMFCFIKEEIMLKKKKLLEMVKKLLKMPQMLMKLKMLKIKKI